MRLSELEALALADAAGALDAREQEELRTRLSALAPDVRAHVQRLYDVAVALAASAPPVDAPARVRANLLAWIAGPTRFTLGVDDGQWNESGVPGMRVKVLSMDQERGLMTMLVRAEPGTRVPSHRHSAPEECYVISGSIAIDGRILRAGDFHHADADSDHGEIISVEGAEVLLVAGISDYTPAQQ